MNCDGARELFSDRIDGVLGPGELAAFEAHLSQCPDCRRELDRFRAAVSLLGRVEPARAPAGFVDRVVEAAHPRPWYRTVLRQLFVPLAVKLPAEAAAVVLVAGLAVLVFERTPELQRAARDEITRPAPPAESPPTVAAPRTETSAGDSSRGASAPPRSTGLAHLDAKPTRGSTESRTQGSAGSPARGSTESDNGRESESRKEKESASTEPLSKTAPPREVPSKGNLGDAAGPGARSLAEPGLAPEGKPSPPAMSSGDAAEQSVVQRLEQGPRARMQQSPESPAAPPPPALRGSPASPAPAPPLSPGSGPSTAALAPPSPSPVSPPSAPLAAPPAASALRAPTPVDVVGRLTVADHEAAGRSLLELISRSGGTVTSRRSDGPVTTIDALVPRSAYPEFTRELARIGTWVTEAEAPTLPSEVRITVRLLE